MPVCQAMLLPLLWQEHSNTVLNLGMGSGVFERFFRVHPEINLTSVEKSPQVNAMAREYFYLPEHTKVHCQSAEEYLANNSKPFNFIICDIFSGQNNLPCINEDSFYQLLSKNLNQHGVVSLNIEPESEEKILKILRLCNKYFAGIALVEFENYKNIVLLLSLGEIPEKQWLLKQNEIKVNAIGIDLSEYILSMHNVTK